nr:hypothetical protein Iba_chr12cCG17630 [Ipomoea batatas]
MPKPHPHFTIASLASSDPQALHDILSLLLLSSPDGVGSSTSSQRVTSFFKDSSAKHGCCTERACPGSNQACKHTLPSDTFQMLQQQKTFQSCEQDLEQQNVLLDMTTAGMFSFSTSIELFSLFVSARAPCPAGWLPVPELFSVIRSSVLWTLISSSAKLSTECCNSMSLELSLWTATLNSSSLSSGASVSSNRGSVCSASDSKDLLLPVSLLLSALSIAGTSTFSEFNFSLLFISSSPVELTAVLFSSFSCTSTSAQPSLELPGEIALQGVLLLPRQDNSHYPVKDDYLSHVHHLH